jgi:hypothetical protein
MLSTLLYIKHIKFLKLNQLNDYQDPYNNQSYYYQNM